MTNHGGKRIPGPGKTLGPTPRPEIRKVRRQPIYLSPQNDAYIVSQMQEGESFSQALDRLLSSLQTP